MTVDLPEDISALLQAHVEGKPDALHRLLPLVYEELRQLARQAFYQQNPAHTLQPTALAHEAWLKISSGMERVSGREHFFAIASRAMRQILTDHARSKRAAKRGGGHRSITLAESLDGRDSLELDLIDLDDCLTQLEALNPRHAQVVELRFLGGLTIEETARALDISTSTVDSDWVMARAWLRRRLKS